MDTEHTERCQNYWWGKLEPCRWGLQCNTISRPVAGLKKRSTAARVGKYTGYFSLAMVEHNQKHLVEEDRVRKGREGRSVAHPAELRDHVSSHTQSREWLRSETNTHSPCTNINSPSSTTYWGPRVQMSEFMRVISPSNHRKPLKKKTKSLLFAFDRPIKWCHHFYKQCRLTLQKVGHIAVISPSNSVLVSVSNRNVCMPKPIDA